MSRAGQNVNTMLYALKAAYDSLTTMIVMPEIDILVIPRKRKHEYNDCYEHAIIIEEASEITDEQIKILTRRVNNAKIR